MQPIKIKKQKYLPLIVSGCSGVGKGTLINCIIQSFPQLFDLSVSYTTRKPRPGQIDGKHYFFIQKSKFQDLIKQDQFLEHCSVHGNYYGTSKKFVQSVVDSGKVCLLDVDIQGAQKIQKLHPNWHYLFVMPPSLEQLQSRLRGRKTETEQAIKIRTTNARKQLDRVKELTFYRLLVNDQIKTCYRQFVDYLNQLYHLLIQIQE